MITSPPIFVERKGWDPKLDALPKIAQPAPIASGENTTALRLPAGRETRPEHALFSHPPEIIQVTAQSQNSSNERAVPKEPTRAGPPPPNPHVGSLLTPVHSHPVPLRCVTRENDLRRGDDCTHCHPKFRLKLISESRTKDGTSTLRKLTSIVSFHPTDLLLVRSREANRGLAKRIRKRSKSSTRPTKATPRR